MKVQEPKVRVQKYLKRYFKSPAYRWLRVADPRDARGRRWKRHSELLTALLLGLASGCLTLRDIEDLTEDLGPFGRRFIKRRVPDTTLWDFLVMLSVRDLREQLIAQVKFAWRAKCFVPVGLPCGVLSVDGKGLGALEHDANGTAQKTHNAEGKEYYLARSLRAVLTSAEGRPCIDQMSIGAKTNEMGDFARFFRQIINDYGGNNDLFEIVSNDAGMTSLENADLVVKANKAYVMAIKGNQPELFREAERVLGSRRKPDAETPWVRYRGKAVRRLFFRTDEMAGYHGWSHLRQAWRVVQQTRDNDGKIEREDRYFVTNIRWGRLTPEQCMLVIRGHWRIENDCFWSLDMQWKEDSVPGCSKGTALEALSWIRLMAYNLVQNARRRVLRQKLPDKKLKAPTSWKHVFEWFKQAWQLPLEPIPVCG